MKIRTEQDILYLKRKCLDRIRRRKVESCIHFKNKCMKVDCSRCWIHLKEERKNEKR